MQFYERPPACLHYPQGSSLALVPALHSIVLAIQIAGKSPQKITTEDREEEDVGFPTRIPFVLFSLDLEH